MLNTSAGSFTRRRPDILAEELVALFSLKPAAFEFKPLFDLVFATLRARNAVSGGEEMLRLRVYEKLQSLVSMGVVRKTIKGATKTYKGISTPLLALSGQMKAFREEWAARPSPVAVVA